MPTRTHRFRDAGASGGAAGAMAVAIMSALIGAGLGGCQQPKASKPPTFRQAMDRAMPKFGEGNMIVIADAAFPALSHSGVNTVPMGVSSIEALKDVLASSSAYGHVAPHLWVDRELMQLTDAQAPGIEKFRARLQEAAGSVPIDASLAQNDLRTRIIEVAATHRVIIIKTPNRLPFSTLYVEFDHGNWTPEQDAQLRSQMSR